MQDFVRLRRHLPVLGLLIALVVAFALPARQTAAQAYSSNYSTTLAYMNLGSTTAQISFTFYPSSGATPVTRPPRTLAPNAAAFLTMVGTTSASIGFTTGSTAADKRGNLVISSTQRVVAVVVQNQTGTLRTRNVLLSSGFSADALDTVVYVPTYMRAGSGTNPAQKMSSRLAIQNATDATVSAVTRFYSMTQNTPVMTVTRSIDAGEATYIDAGNVGTTGVEGSIPAGFSGSAVIEADGNVVASLIEAFGVSSTSQAQAVNAQMGIPASATAQEVYIPAALCKVSSRTTTLAVQNAGTATATVTPTLVSATGVATDGAPLTIEPGLKATVSACAISSNATFNGAMKLTSSENIAVIAKEDGAGWSSAFEGMPAAAAADTLAVPFIRNAQNDRYTNASNRRLRGQIIIQNVGAALSAGKLLVNYYDSSGNLIGTHTINSAVPTGASISVSPGSMTLAANLRSGSRALTTTQQTTLRNNFGYFRYVNTSTQSSRLAEGQGGGAIVTCAADVVDCSLLATVRIIGNNTSTANSTSNNHSETYNAVPVN